MATPPSVVVYKDAYATAAGSTTRVLTSRTVATGDVVAVICQTENWSGASPSSLAKTAGTATIGTITKQRDAGSASHCGLVLFTFTVTTGGTLTLTMTATAAMVNNTAWTYVATGCGGVGNTAMTTSAASTITASLTTSANSYVLAIAGDWAAAGSATTTLTPAGAASPADAHETDGVVDQGTGGSIMSSRGGHWNDSGAPATTSYGVTVPTSTGYNLVVCELLGTAGGAAAGAEDPQRIITRARPVLRYQRRQRVRINEGLSVPVYTRVHSAPLWSNSNTSGAALSVTVSPTGIGDLMVVSVLNQGGTSVASLSGGGVTTWTRVGTPWTDPETTPSILEFWWGVVTTTGSQSLSVTFAAAVGAHFNEVTAQDFHSSVPGTWAAEDPGGTITNKTNASSGTVTYPAVTTTQPPEIYCGYASTPSAISTSSPMSGFTAGLTSGNDCFILSPAYSGGGVQPTHGVSLSEASWAVGACFYMSATPPSTPVALADVAAAEDFDAMAASADVQLADVAAGEDLGALAAPAAVPEADVAGSVDALTFTVSTSLPDAAGAAEQLAVSATVPAAEVAAGAEALSLAAAVPLAEVAASAETVAVAATVPLAEKAAGVESLPQPPVSVSPADVAGAADAVAATASVPVAETGAASESLAVTATTAAVDAAAAADQLSVSAAASLQDTGAGAETPAATATVPLADVAAAAEAQPRMLIEAAGAADAISVVVGAVVAYADAGGAAEAPVVSVTTAAPDVAGGCESLSVAASVSLADAAGAADLIGPVAAVPVADTGAAAEAQLIGVAPADAAGAAEALAVSAAVPAADVAAGADAVSVTQGTNVAFTESAGAAEAPAVAVASPAAEAAGAADGLAASAALVFADQAGAADAIAVVAGNNPALPDAAAAADSSSVSASVGPADAAGSVESAAASATVPLPERAAAVEAPSVSAILATADAAAAADGLTTAQTASPVLGDAAGGREALSASVTTACTDTAAASETLAVAQSRALTDAAAAAESLVYVIPPTGPQPVWEVGPAEPRWQVLATAPAWQVDAAGPRWEAVATPPRWDVSAAPARWRVIMAVFDPIASVSVENVNATWTSDLGGTEVDPVAGAMPVRFAFPVSSGDEVNPAQPSSWFTGTWLAPVAGRYKGFIAQVIVGPTAQGGLVQLTRGGKYDVWSEVDTGAETVRKFVGVQAVY